MSHRDRVAARLIPAGVLLVPVLLSLRLPSSLDGLDSVNFALALEEFDPGLEQPHFPGYPAYIFLCRILFLAGLDAPLALALPGVIASAALVPALLGVAARCAVETRTAWIAVGLLALHPLLLVEGPRPAPDLLGTCIAWGALALACAGRPAPAGLLVAIGMGVRPDLAPFVLLGALLPPRSRSVFALALGAGLAAWVPAFLLAVPREALPGAVEFARGHFGSWGSTLVGGAGSRGAIVSSLLLLGPGVVGLLLAPIGLRRLPPPLGRVLLWGVAPYAVWVLVGQNLAHPRHFLPLLPALALLLARALAIAPRSAWRGAAAALLVATALPVSRAVVRPPLDGRSMVSRAVAICGGCDLLYVGDSKRLFERYAPPGFPAYRRPDLEGIRRDLAAWGLSGADVLASSEVEGARRLGTPLGELGGGLRVYRIDPAALRYRRAAVQPDPLLHAGEPRRDRGPGGRARLDLLTQPGAQPDGGGGPLRAGHQSIAQPLDLP